ncbi:MAG: hypothetical protein AABW79_01175 [Nanoarchaeota archaeon]
MRVVQVLGIGFLLFLLIVSFTSATNGEIKLDSPLIQGNILKGAFTFEPSSIGKIPLDSRVKINLNEISLQYPLRDFLSELYLAKNVHESEEFAPEFNVVLVIGKPSIVFPGNPGGSGSSGGSSSSKGDECIGEKNCISGGGDSPGGNQDSFAPLFDLITAFVTHNSFLPHEEEEIREVSITFSKNNPASFNLGNDETYRVKEVRLYGELVSEDLISVSLNGDVIEFTTEYAEDIELIDEKAESIEISFSEFGIIIPPRGEMSVEVSYRAQVLARSDINFYAFKSVSGADDTTLLTKFPFIPGAPLPGELIEKGCGAYVCGEWGSCTPESLKELVSVERTLSLIQTRQCLLDCGISFTQDKPCEIKKKLVSVVRDDSVDLKESDEGQGSAKASVFDKYTATQVARIEVSSIGGDSADLRVILTQSQKAKLDYCYNGVFDAPLEEEVDCGGYCGSCKKQKIEFRTLALWGVFILGILALFVSFNRTYAE